MELPRKVGFKVHEYASLVGLSRSALYALPAELQPQSVKFGSAKVIIEEPGAYLRRIAAAQAQANKPE